MDSNPPSTAQNKIKSYQLDKKIIHLHDSANADRRERKATENTAHTKQEWRIAEIIIEKQKRMSKTRMDNKD